MDVDAYVSFVWNLIDMCDKSLSPMSISVENDPHYVLAFGYPKSFNEKKY